MEHEEREATRPIDLDKEALKWFVQQDLMPQVVRWLKKHPHPDKPIGTASNVATGDFRVEQADGRDSHIVEVQVNFRPSSAKGAAVLGGKLSGLQIDLYVNGAITPNDWLVPTPGVNRLQPLSACTTETCLAYGLYSILTHELTHSADVFVKKLKYDPKKVQEGGVEEWGPYINDPTEVRAFMQQIVDETERMARKIGEYMGSNQKLVNTVLLTSTTWKIIEKYLTAKNRARILKAVYDMLDRKGLLKEAAATRVATRYLLLTAARTLLAEDYLKIGDLVYYGKYKNHVGKIVAFGKDKWGSPTMEIEPVPKGRKQNKIMSVFKVWRKDVVDTAKAEKARLEAEAAQAKLAGLEDGDEDEDEDDP